MKIINIRKMSVVLSGLLLSVNLYAADSPPKNVITMEQAQATALKKYSGTVKSSEFEHEKGQWVYSFDIQGKDDKIHEVLVNAKSGKIVSHSIETPAQEAAEKKSE